MATLTTTSAQKRYYTIYIFEQKLLNCTVFQRYALQTR